METLIGAGGWAYFQVGGLDSLEAYSRVFNFVEVNSTFYDYPELDLVKNWKKRVPSDFQFSVRCHRDLSHRFRLEPTKDSFQCMERMMSICRILSGDMLLIQTPNNFKFTNKKLRSIDSFLSSLDLKDVRLIWEARITAPLPEKLVDIMSLYGIVHCTDLSVKSPGVRSDILYSRLFGKGHQNVYQFDDQELKEINVKTEGDYRKKVLSFHGVRMYKDAARFKIYKETGVFPQATGSTGLDSVEEILKEDAVFPSSKQDLIEHQGWKIIDVREEVRIRASTILEQIPDKTYHNIPEVLKELNTMI